MADRRTVGGVLEMLGLETKPDGRWHGVSPERASGLGLQRAIAIGRLDRGAGALGDQLPGVALVVDRRGAGAGGAGTGGAVVLAGQRDAIALFLGGLVGGDGGTAGGERREGERGDGDLGLVHEERPCVERMSAGAGGGPGPPGGGRHPGGGGGGGRVMWFL